MTICGTASPPIFKVSSMFVTTELCSDRGIPGYTNRNVKAGLGTHKGDGIETVASGRRERK
jgi:hypothetical protein